jgi:hypothetical protein
MRLFTSLMIGALLICSQAVADSENDGWQPVAFLEFQSSAAFAEAVQLAASGTLTETDYDQREKKRVETLKRVDPDTGKTIVETETVVSGKSSEKVTKETKTYLLTIDTREVKVEGKQERQWRLSVDGVAQMDLDPNEVQLAKKLVRSFERAVTKVQRGARGRPFVQLQFGDKIKGVEIRADYMAPRPDLGAKTLGSVMRATMWIGGKAYGLQPQVTAFGFLSDVSKMDL